MRNRLVERLVEHARDDPQLVFLTGDLGYNVVEPLADVLGARFVNAGIAEANMVTMAGALAACGLHPWVYSIAPFATVRCLEQLRNDVCYERRAVKVVGIGGGYSYGTLGPTHHALEDAALMAALPHMVVACPSTVAELDRLFDLLADTPEPVYFRLDRDPGPAIDGGAFARDGLLRYRGGDDIDLITAGSLLTEVLAAADLLAAGGVSAGVHTVPVPVPFPEGALAETGSGPLLAIFEGFEGNPLEAGALRVCAAAGRRVGWVNAGRSFARSVGQTQHLRARAGLDAVTIAAAASTLLRR